MIKKLLFLSFVVSGNGIPVDEEKVKVILEKVKVDGIQVGEEFPRVGNLL